MRKFHKTATKRKAALLSPKRYPSGLTSQEKRIFEAFYDSVESDLQSVGKRSK